MLRVKLYCPQRYFCFLQGKGQEQFLLQQYDLFLSILPLFEMHFVFLMDTTSQKTVRNSQDYNILVHNVLTDMKLDIKLYIKYILLLLYII